MPVSVVTVSTGVRVTAPVATSEPSLETPVCATAAARNDTDRAARRSTLFVVSPTTVSRLPSSRALVRTMLVTSRPMRSMTSPADSSATSAGTVALPELSLPVAAFRPVPMKAPTQPQVTVRMAPSTSNETTRPVRLDR